MKAVVQNPIQSFNALGRHIFRGSIFSLPLFFSTLIVLLFSVYPLQAQSQNNGAKPDSDTRLDVLFDQIMETLPEEKRSRVDSAGTKRAEQQADSPETSRNRSEESAATATRLRQLPQELRVQVERVIADIEQRKEERKERFRESQRKK